jgi:hypothetical protein
MKTTAIFVEQVLIGLLVLAIGAIPFMSWWHLRLTLESIATGAGIVAVAYLLGIIFDRFADTLFSRLEQYHRLLRAAKPEEGVESEKQKEDPYPEGEVRASILLKEGAAVDWIDYLRSRIRLSRALAVFLPAVTVSGLLAVVTGHRIVGLWRYLPPTVFVVVALTYLITFIAVLKAEPLPKTWDDNLKAAIKRFSPWKEPVAIAGYVLAAFALELAILCGVHDWEDLPEAVAILAIGAGLSALSARAWWRISKTYMDFILTCRKAMAQESEPGTTGPGATPRLHGPLREQVRDSTTQPPG